ncbi:MAG: hypothetical protein ACLUF5_03750 [Clostridia bacterium]
MVTSKNLNNLNNYFTKQEFSFINGLDSENLKLNELNSKELNYQNMFNNILHDLDIHNKDEICKTLIAKTENILVKINENISNISDLKNRLESISAKITELLLEVEANPTNKDNYFDKIQDLKDTINNLSIDIEDTKSKILVNDIHADTFLKNPDVIKYINFKTDIDLPVESEISLSSSDDDIHDNNTLLISEKLQKVFLPYSVKEVMSYLEQYPKEYSSFSDVVNKEFIFPYSYYSKHTVVSRFREAYSLIRDRESKSIIDAFKFAVDIMFNYELNPAIIAACKTQEELENYLSCLNRQKLDEFTTFEIKYEISPLKI